MEISLALGGGGVKGIAHLGVLQCLEDEGVTIRALAGTSAGGLVGAVYAAGYRPKEILALLQSVDPRRLYARQPGDGPALMGYTGLAEALVAALGDKQFSDLKLPFACVAVDTRTSQEVYLTNGAVVEAVLATIAFPGVLPPQIRGDAELVDGGILNPVPVNLARWLAPTYPVVAVPLNPARSAWKAIPQASSLPAYVPLHIPTPLLEGFSHMRLGQSLRIFLQSMDISARMMTELRLEMDQPEVIIRPDVALIGTFDTVDPQQVYQAGYRAALRALPKIIRTNAWRKRLHRFILPPHARLQTDDQAVLPDASGEQPR